MRLTLFLTLILAALYLPYPVVLLFFVVYVFKYPGYELMLLGFIIDAEFGMNGYGGVLYTASATVLVILGLLIKPHLRLYETI